jgi:flagellar hook assembly protein FlgD
MDPKPGPAASTVTARLTKSKISTKDNTKVKVTVKTKGAAPTGKVQVRWGSKVLRTATLKKGKATITVPKFKKARKYRLRVVYLGSSAVKASKSKLLSVRVVKK